MRFAKKTAVVNSHSFYIREILILLYLLAKVNQFSCNSTGSDLSHVTYVTIYIIFVIIFLSWYWMSKIFNRSNNFVISAKMCLFLILICIDSFTLNIDCVCQYIPNVFASSLFIISTPLGILSSSEIFIIMKSTFNTYLRSLEFNVPRMYENLYIISFAFFNSIGFH